MQIGGFDVSAIPLNHPGGAFAYRVRGQTGDLVYATDHEFGDPAFDEPLAEFARGAAALVLDAHFTPEELPAHRGWGHSHWRQCAEFAGRVDAGGLWLFHHKPGRTDEALRPDPLGRAAHLPRDRDRQRRRSAPTLNPFLPRATNETFRSLSLFVADVRRPAVTVSSRSEPTPTSFAGPTTPTHRWRSRRRPALFHGGTSDRRTSAAGHRHRRRRRGPVAPDLRGVRDERRLGDRRQRRDVAGDLRAHAVDEHRRHRGRAVQSRHRLGRHRRGEHLPRVDARRRHLQVDATAAARCSTWGSPTRRRSPASSIHPTNPDIVYVAASGHEWTDNEMRGVFKTTDGGRTWKKVLYKSPRTGAIDLVMDPRDPNTLYAAMWQRIRRKWSDPRVEPGYSESGIWKTTDGGSRLDRREPAACRRRSFAAASASTLAASNPKVLYAFVDNYEAGTARRSEGERDAYGRPIIEARIKARRNLSHRRQRRDVAQGQRDATST